jgi:hypothetical protein
MLLLVLFTAQAFAQQSGHDMIVLKNNKGRTVKTFFNGQTIDMGASGREVFGVIRKIRDDSLFIQYYDVRKAYNMWGTSVLDTVTSFLLPYGVDEINWIRKPPAKFEFVRNGVLFMVGGTGYVLLHVINAAYLKQPVIGSTVAIAGGIAVTGFVMNKLRKRKYEIGRGYELKYIPMN